jgi:hypothetical protein
VPQAFLAAVPPEHHAEFQAHATRFDAAFARSSPRSHSIASAQLDRFVKGAQAAGVPWAQILVLMPIFMTAVQQIIAAFEPAQGGPHG